MAKKILDTAMKTELDAAKTASKKVVHGTVEFKGNKIVEKIMIANTVPDENSRNVDEINIPPEKRPVL